MSEKTEQTDGYQQLSAAAGTAPAPDAASTMVAAPGGILLPQTNVAPAPSPALAAPGAASPTNAAPVRDWHAQLGSAMQKLMAGGMSPMNAAVAGAVHALAHSDQPEQSDTPRPSNTTWNNAQSNADASRPTVAPRQQSNGQKVVSGIEANLGDIASATEGGTAGGGIMGAFRVAKASTSRQRQEHEDNVKMSTANAQMLHEQRLIHSLGEEEVAKATTIGKQSADDMMSAPHAETIASGKTSDDIKKMVDGNPDIATKYAIFLTGRVATGTDANGIPRYRSTYTIVKPGERIHPSEESLKFLNDNVPGADYTMPDKDGKNGQSFSSHDFTMIQQRAANQFAMTEMIKKNTAEGEERAHKLNLEKGDYDLINNDAVRHAMSLVKPLPNNEYDYNKDVKAFEILKDEYNNDPSLAKQLPKNWQEQYAHAMSNGAAEGKPGSFSVRQEKLAEIREKATEKGGSILDSYSQDPSKFGGEKLPAVQAAADDAIKQAVQIQDPAQREIVISAAKHAKAMAESQSDYEAKQKGAETTARDTAKKNVEITGSNGSTLTGDAFLQTLPVARRATIQGYIDGTSTWTQRVAGSKFGESLLQDIRQAAGGAWDETKGQAYAKNRLGFTSGKESVGIGAANTAMHHLGRLWDHLDDATAGWLGKAENAVSFGHANKSGQAVQVDANAVTGELGRLYTGGVIGEHDAELWRAKLDPFAVGMTVEKLRTNTKEFIGLLGGKLQSLQNQWDDGKPSDAMGFDKGIISQENLDKYGSITGENLKITDIQKGPAAKQQQQQQTPAAPSQNTGGSVIVQTPHGPMTFKNQQQADSFKRDAGIQ